MGSYDYCVYSNSLVDKVQELNHPPIKTVGIKWASISHIGKAEDANQTQLQHRAR